MTDRPHLKNAPIVEAVLDIRPKFIKPPGQDPINDFASRVGLERPIARDIQQFQTRLSVEGSRSSVATNTEPLGKICWTTDDSRAVQGRIDGFTVNHIGRYDGWKSLRDDAQQFFPIYRELFGVTAGGRLALRFINRIAIPHGMGLKKFFRLRLDVPKQFPRNVDDLLYRVVIPFGENRRVAIMVQTLPLDAEPGKRAVALDVDAFVDGTFDLTTDGFWREFEELRKIKNDCFFESLQESTWEAYR